MSPSNAAPKTSGQNADFKEASKPPAEEVTAPATRPMAKVPETQPSVTAEAQHGGAPSFGDPAKPVQASGEDLVDFGDDVSQAAASNGRGNTESGSLDPQDPEQQREDAANPLASSIATLKPATSPTTTTATQYLTIESKAYIDPTPSTPMTSPTPSRTPSNAPHPRFASSSSTNETSPSRTDAVDEERRYASEEEQENGSRSEIQSILEQFSEEGGGPGEEEVMSPRLEIASPLLSTPTQHPPRKSSLEPLAPNIAHQIQELQGLRLSSSSPTSTRSKQKESDDHGPPVPPKDGTSGKLQDERRGSMDSPMSPTMSLHRPPPPEPDAEPSLPFDFHRFLEQLRNKKADPVARYLKSFLSEFSKRQWMVHEQVKIIGDFLAFIANKMAVCEVWKEVSDAEFDNAREGMEKLVMNRLYSQTFSPAIPSPQPIPGAKSKKKGAERPLGPGRRGQHQEDVERDEILAQKINIYGWIKEEHLDILPVGDSGKRFLKLAQQELMKIKSYRAPRDKIICVLNCCKVIFGLLKNAKSDSSADSFMPLLIYVVLQANPEHLVSNVQYVLRFRNQDKLGGEAGYYLSSLMGAIQFIENMDRTTLTISDEEFEQNVEAAVSAIAEKHRAESPPPPPLSEKTGLTLQPHGLGESSSTRPSMDLDARPGTPRLSTSSEGPEDEKAAITGLLRTIQRPLSTIGRMFSDDPSSPAGPSGGSSGGPSGGRSPVHTPQPERLSPRPSADAGAQPPLRHSLSAEEAAARQASAEAAEAQRLHRAEHANVVETLAGMFPDLDREIISDVVYQKEGRVGLAVDACLALSS